MSSFHRLGFLDHDRIFHCHPEISMDKIVEIFYSRPGLLVDAYMWRSAGTAIEEK